MALRCQQASSTKQKAISCKIHTICRRPEKIPKELFPIIDLFVEDNDDKPLSLIKIHMGRLFLEGDEEQELMLRLNGPELTVARIAFRHRRQGYMTRLEQMLLDICAKLPDKKGICIESVESKAMLKYCRKNGYKGKPYCETDFIKECRQATTADSN